MKVRVNGEPQVLRDAENVAELLAELGYESRFVAVAVNKNCVRRGAFAATLVNEGDEIEVLAPMAGG